MVRKVKSRQEGDLGPGRARPVARCIYSLPSRSTGKCNLRFPRKRKIWSRENRTRFFSTVSIHLFGRETTRPGQMFRKLTSYANKQTTRLFFRHHDTLRHITYDTPLEITIAIDNLTLVSLTTTLPPRSHSRHTGQGIKTV